MTQLARLAFRYLPLSIHRAPLLLGLVAVSALGCGEDRFFGGTAAPVVLSSRLNFLPKLFQGDVECRPGDNGQFQSYVVDLYKPRATADAGFAAALATSPAARCDREVEFLVPRGLPFAVVIRAYDIPSEELRRQNLDDVEPKWLAECGTGSSASDAGIEQVGPVISVPGRLVVKTCTKLRLARETIVEVDLQQARGSFDCGTAPGQIATYTATVDGNEAQWSQSADCGEIIRFVGLSDGPHTIEVTAATAAIPADAGTPATALDAGCEAVVVSSPAASPDAGSGVSDAEANIIDAAVVTPPDAGAAVTPTSCAPSDAEGPTRWQTSCTVQAVEGRSATAECAALTAIP